MEKVFFKIIIPNYNNMPYIKKCLDSILEQTFQDFKIIIVDDLSTDNSDKFCEMYARKYPTKITFIKAPKKCYAGGCRNIGIDDLTINSQYTVFIDSDDWLYNNSALEKLHNFIYTLKNKPLMIRVPLFHFFGENDRKNRMDVFKSTDKKDIYMTGPGPGRTCIASTIKCHFIENRANSNDVIWFLRCLDQMDDNKIVKVDFPFYVYNRISVNSCQNAISMQLNKKVIDDYTINLVSDLKKEKFITNICNEIKTYEISRRINMHKKIDMHELLKNAVVISIDIKRYKQFVMLFNRLNLFPTPKLIFGEISTSLNSKSKCCKLSHIKAVEYAKNKKLPYVLIFEDDAYPCKDIANKFQQYLQCIPSNANMIILGWSSGLKHNYVNLKPYNRIYDTTISGAHSYILFEKAYDKWLKLMNTEKGRSKNTDFYPPDNFIFYDIGNAYILNTPLFIQYNKVQSMHNHMSYVFNGSNTEPPENFEKIEKLLI